MKGGDDDDKYIPKEIFWQLSQQQWKWILHGHDTMWHQDSGKKTTEEETRTMSAVVTGHSGNDDDNGFDNEEEEELTLASASSWMRCCQLQGRKMQRINGDGNRGERS